MRGRLQGEWNGDEPDRKRILIGVLGEVEEGVVSRWRLSSESHWVLGGCEGGGVWRRSGKGVVTRAAYYGSEICEMSMPVGSMQ